MGKMMGFSTLNPLVLAALFLAPDARSPINERPIFFPQQQSGRSDSLFIQVIDAISRNDLFEADRIIDGQLALGRDSLQWFFFKGIRFYSDLFGADNAIKKSSLVELSSSFSRVIQMADERLEFNPTDSMALFFGGGAYGYNGFSFLADGSIFKAVSSAKKGARYHEKLIALHPNCYDAYLGPGLLNLAASASPWILKPILFILGISGTEEDADRYLSTAYEKGSWVRIEAGTYLAQLYARQKQFSRSCDLYLTLTQSYPMRLGLRAEALSGLLTNRQYDQVISLSKDAIRSFEAKSFHFTSQDSSRVPSIFSSCSYAYRLNGDTTAAIRVWNGYLTLPAYDRLPKWWAHSSLAELHMLQRDTTLALQSLTAIAEGDAPEKSKKKARDQINELNKVRH